MDSLKSGVYQEIRNLESSVSSFKVSLNNLTVEKFQALHDNAVRHEEMVLKQIERLANLTEKPKMYASVTAASAGPTISTTPKNSTEPYYLCQGPSDPLSNIQPC